MQGHIVSEYKSEKWMKRDGIRTTVHWSLVCTYLCTLAPSNIRIAAEVVQTVGVPGMMDESWAVLELGLQRCMQSETGRCHYLYPFSMPLRQGSMQIIEKHLGTKLLTFVVCKLNARDANSTSLAVVSSCVRTMYMRCSVMRLGWGYLWMYNSQCSPITALHHNAQSRPTFNLCSIQALVPKDTSGVCGRRVW